MVEAEPLRHPWIIGPGRLGLALATCLARADPVDGLTVSGRSGVEPRHPVLADPKVRYAPIASPPTDPSLIVITVPDAAIGSVATELARLELPAIPVLHTSGVLSASVLEPLARRGLPVGSMHPMASISDPGAGATRLRNAFFGIEGDERARAAASRLVEILKGRSLRVEATGKPAYHAAAVFASNYVVVLLAIGERLLTQAGVEPEAARAAVVELASGAVANVAASTPVEALTGPVSRGDAETITRHLAGLSVDDRTLYSGLARAALDLARQQGLDPADAGEIARTLQPVSP